MSVDTKTYAVLLHSGFMGDERREWSVDVFNLAHLCAAAKLSPAEVVPGQVDDLIDALAESGAFDVAEPLELLYASSQDGAAALAREWAIANGYACL